VLLTVYCFVFVLNVWINVDLCSEHTAAFGACVAAHNQFTTLPGA